MHPWRISRKSYISLAMGFGHRRIRLAAGELLVLDNGRWLHGRDRLSQGSGRFLWRYWLRRPRAQEAH